MVELPANGVLILDETAGKPIGDNHGTTTGRTAQGWSRAPNAERRRSARQARQLEAGLQARLAFVHAVAAASAVLSAIFRYLPMAGNVIAFRQFQPGGSIFGEKWVGFKYITLFINDPSFWQAFQNTIILGVLTLVFCFPMPIIFALMLNELQVAEVQKVRADRGLPAALHVRGDHRRHDPAELLHDGHREPDRGTRCSAPR
jgi:hypothetical protein